MKNIEDEMIKAIDEYEEKFGECLTIMTLEDENLLKCIRHCIKVNKPYDEVFKTSKGVRY